MAPPSAQGAAPPAYEAAMLGSPDAMTPSDQPLLSPLPDVPASALPATPAWDFGTNTEAYGGDVVPGSLGNGTRPAAGGIAINGNGNGNGLTGTPGAAGTDAPSASQVGCVSAVA